MALTNIAIRNAKPRQRRYKLFDGGGLYLEVYPQGGRYWRLKYRLGGKERRLSIGVYPEIAIPEARVARDEARKMIAAGRDPMTEKRAAKAIAAVNAATTFERVTLEWMNTNAEKWSESYANKILDTLRANLFPHIGALPIANITPPLLLAALKPVEARGAYELVGRMRAWCGQIFRYAIATGRATNDSAAALRGAFKVRTPKNYPHLTHAELVDCNN